MPIELLRGMRDFPPADAIRLRGILSKVEDVFRRFGFYPIETPSLESTDTLNAKTYGQEAAKSMYVMDGGDAGLVYDLTVPLARYVSANMDMPLPFKRYQTARVWRRDEPQRMRSREFIQADIDVVGSREPSSEAEVIAATALALEAVGIMEYEIALSSRVILNAILDLFKIPKEKQAAVTVIIDKLGKISADEAIAQIAALGVEARSVEGLLSFVNDEMKNADKLQKLATNAPEAKAEAERIGVIVGMLSNYHLSGTVKVDFSLARGLDYYTGTVWEFVARDGEKRLPSIASGGRYDSLMAKYSRRELPAVGSSIGISRVFDITKGGAPRSTYAVVYVANIGQMNLDYATTVANFLRSRGVCADLNLTDRGISKQLEHASALGIRYTAIVGDREREANKIKLRDMSSGAEELLDLESLTKRLKQEG